MSPESLRQPQESLPRIALGAPAPRFAGEDDELLPPRITAEGTLRRILISALKHFGQHGYHAASMRAIAKEAGMRASSMYEHRASKEDLLVELMVAGHEEIRDWLLEAKRSAGSPAADQVDAIVRADVRFHATYPLLARVCNRELGSLSPARLEQVMQVRNSLVHVISDAIDRGVRLGTFRIHDGYLAAAAIGAMGIRVAEWYTPATGYTVDEVAESYAAFALRLLGDGDLTPR
ncbi:MAG: TetR family transcriptional regulator [Candidatus Dormibacteraeota bacterium]|nr:TetR family transcriptional regulator [Candidatus Dormibacteraeota bacterium]